MIVNSTNLVPILEKLSSEPYLSLDCEATGLYPYKGDRLFSIIIGAAHDTFYFNFNAGPDHLGNNIDSSFILDIRDFSESFARYFNASRVWFLHNAKYDMHLLSMENIFLDGSVHCTQAIARLIYNDHLNYSLDFLAKEYLNESKDDTVKQYVQKNKLFDWTQIPGKKKRTKLLHYEQVPFGIMAPYGEKDARITYDLGMYQISKIEELDRELPDNKPKLIGVMENERRLTRTLFEMERRGIKIDKRFTQDALDFEKLRIETATMDFKRISGIDFKDSNKVLAEAFSAVGESFPTTEKGNPSFKDDVLSKMESPLAKTVQEFRDANKKAYTYYANYLDLCDQSNLIHASARQAGTATGRMSYSDPNLQQVHKIEEGDPRYDDKFLARRCFIPNPGSSLLMLDYDQQEYRLMLDYAGEMPIIEEVLSGKDVHQATADIMGVSRREAKTINFMLLYGGGVQKLADTLGCSFDEAKHKREHYFRKLPKVSAFIKGVIKAAETRGYIFNWYGRRSYIQKDFAYKAPNYLIQGGCADIVKVAMNKTRERLAHSKTQPLIQVHDELVFSLDRSEHHLVPEIKQIMETSYPHRHLPLTVGADISDVSWQDKKPYSF